MEEEMKRTQTLLGQVVVGKHLTAANMQPAQIKAAQEQHIDPLNVMEEEMKRMQTLLGMVVVG